MDYSLQNLNKIANLKKLTISEFIERLNLIGLEVDGAKNEKLSTNLFLDDIQLLLKIPANREDLLNENLFLKEMSTIFLFDILDLWKKLKLDYSFLLKQRYTCYPNYSKVNINFKEKNLTSYIIELQNVKIQSSPLWLCNKLKNFGLGSENNVTDIIKLVFNEWGQSINILPFKEREIPREENFNFEYLIKPERYFDTNQTVFELQPGTVVLKNNNQIISVLGIIRSSFLSSIQDQTCQNFLLEATFYDIHQNPLLLNTLNSKLSLKYLRRTCFENFKYSFQRILTLLELLTSCRIVPTIYSTCNEKISLQNKKILTLKKKNLVNFLNIQSPDTIIFQKAGLNIICETKKEYYFQIPLYRQDLFREIDLIEEYSRFIGYKNFSEIFPSKTVSYTKNLFSQKIFSKNFFLNYGFNEVITNPLVDIEIQNKFSVLINNPLNKEFSSLRHSLIPKLLNTFELNSRSSYQRTNFFEIGRTFKVVKEKVIEQDKLAGIFQISNSKNARNTSEWFVAKGFIEAYLSNFGYKNLLTKKVKENIVSFYPTRSILFIKDNKILGIFGELNPLLAKERYSHVRGAIYLFELNLNYLRDWQINKKINLFIEYSKYPLVVKDLSIIIDKKFDFNFLKSFILSQSIYLKKVKIFDIYFDENSTNKVNVGIRLEFQSSCETLTNEFIESEIEKIKSSILKEFKNFIHT